MISRGLRLTGTTITTDETANIVLDPNGGGKVEVSGDSPSYGDIVATGSISEASHRLTATVI